MKPLLAALSVVLSQAFPSVAKAHELIPQAVLEYVKNNPDATPEQIEAFTKQTAPEFAEKAGDGTNILEIAQNQDASFLDNMADFVRLGIEHILSGPDHILFVLTLLLVFVSFRQTAKLITVFTVAHSVTLILAGLSILTLSSRVVEPLIALSISVLAISSVFFHDNKYIGSLKAKASLVFFFGLFHGLGFAGLLKEVQVAPDKFLSSLVAFNIGVELGQLLIIILALPVIYLCKDRPWYGTFIKTVAVIIAIIGIVWSLQRMMGL